MAAYSTLRALVNSGRIEAYERQLDLLSDFELDAEILGLEHVIELKDFGAIPSSRLSTLSPGPSWPSPNTAFASHTSTTGNGSHPPSGGIANIN